MKEQRDTARNRDRGSSTAPLIDAPAAVLWVLAATAAVSVAALLLPTLAVELYEVLAFIPARFTLAEARWLSPAATLLSPLGYTLLHGGWLHLLLNLGMLLGLGSAMTRRLGTEVFLAAWSAGALGGALASIAVSPHSTTPMIGASAAISAMLGALVVLAWRRSTALGTAETTARSRRGVYGFVLVWLAINALSGLIAFFDGARIAWEAHVRVLDFR